MDLFAQNYGLFWWLRGWSICLQCRETGFYPWVGKIPWRRKWQPTPVFLPGESHGQRSLVGYRLGHDWATSLHGRNGSFIHLTANKLNAYYVSDPGDTMESIKYNHSPYGIRNLLKKEIEPLRTKGIKVSDMLCFNSIISECGLLNTCCLMHLCLYICIHMHLCLYLLPGIAFFPITTY